MMNLDLILEKEEEYRTLEEQKQYFGMSAEIEDREAITEWENHEIVKYQQDQDKYDESLKILNISDRTSFPFTGKNPSSVGKTKQQMFTYTYATARSYKDLELLYTTPTMEYYKGSCSFNKKSRKWSYTTHGYVTSLVEDINDMKNRFFL